MKKVSDHQPILKFNRLFFREFWAILKPFWQSKENKKAGFLLILNAVCILVSVWATVGINTFNKDFYDALGQYDGRLILSSLGYFTFYVMVLILAYGYGGYFNSVVSIRWRRWLTDDYLDRWMKNKAFYAMEQKGNHIDNPDQRISEDLNEFASITLSIFFSLFQSIITLFSFGFILWRLSGSLSFHIASMPFHIPGYLCWAALLYAIVGNYIIAKIGKKLAGTRYQQQKYGADFRFGLIRFREASEQIAMSSGENAEKKYFGHLFSRIYHNYFSVIRLERNLAFFTNGYGTVSSIIGILFSLPLYLSKQVNLGGIMQISSAFYTVQNAFSVFINSFSQLTEWRAIIHRLTEFNAALNHIDLTGHQSIEIQKGDAMDVMIQHLNLTTPSQGILFNDLNLVFKHQQFTLIAGQSGLGKSTLLRTLAGIWEYGSGTIITPRNARTFFLSQKPYLPLGALKYALSYPHADVFDKEQLRLALERCLLPRLAERLNDVESWSQTLSLGEQQLIAFGRIFLHQPDIIYLDESTSSLDEEKEALIYHNLRRYLPQATIISVGHRTSLYALHDKVIDLSKYHPVTINQPNNTLEETMAIEL